jgi:hypothetical protein
MSEKPRYQYHPLPDKGFVIVEPDGSTVMQIVSALQNSLPESLLLGRVQRVVVSLNELGDLTVEQIADGAFYKMRDDRDELLRERSDLLRAGEDKLHALQLVTMELGQMHAHYHPDCKGDCPTGEYIKKAKALIGEQP